MTKNTEWRKSTFSGDAGCVEWRDTDAGREVRDSKNPEGGTLTFTDAEVAAFIAGVAAGEF